LYRLMSSSRHGISTLCEASRSCSSSEATPDDLRDAPCVARGRSFVEEDMPSPVGRKVQPLDERGVQFRGVLGVAQRLFESPLVADQCSSLYLDDAIVPTGLDCLAVQSRRLQNATDNSLVELVEISSSADALQLRSAPMSRRKRGVRCWEGTGLRRQRNFDTLLVTLASSNAREAPSPFVSSRDQRPTERNGGSREAAEVEKLLGQ
jgi:hypothetical protein